MPDVIGYEGNFLAEADGVKVYVFCYEFGYVVTITDLMLALVTYIVIGIYKDLRKITTSPNVLVAEMMMNGSMIYIDTLNVNSSGELPESVYSTKCSITTEKPELIYRSIWNKMPTTVQ